VGETALRDWVNRLHVKQFRSLTVLFVFCSAAGVVSLEDVIEEEANQQRGLDALVQTKDQGEEEPKAELIGLKFALGGTAWSPAAAEQGNHDTISEQGSPPPLPTSDAPGWLAWLTLLSLPCRCCLSGCYN
jgi:hypothetical protein